MQQHTLKGPARPPQASLRQRVTSHGPGRSARELAIVSGVPGRPGSTQTMTLAANRVTIAPPPGEHYYYARLTQDDGSMLWSAPVWVTQQP
jgi:hypothetical protein